MRDKIISYFEMCQREGVALQRGMNFRLHGRHSIILMSLRPNAPYRDRIEEDGSILIYEGHDCPRTSQTLNPKIVDQPEFLPSGLLSENGKFHKVAQEYKRGEKGPDIVKVYEKIKKGIWSDNGYFHLVDSWLEHDEFRNVFKFKLVAIEDIENTNIAEDSLKVEVKRSRVIPTNVKLEVWKRDEGKCAICGTRNELHFDHIVPFSKGGTSLRADNIQLLCARHIIWRKGRRYNNEIFCRRNR